MNETLKQKIIKAQEGDKLVLNELVEDNCGLIYSIIKRFENRGCEREDLYQIGAIGLIKAIKKFDFSYNVALSTYAVSYIIGEIKKFLRDDGIIKVSRQYKTLALQVNIERKNNPLITIEELSKKLGCEKEEIAIAISSTNPIESLESKENEDDLSLMEKICSKDNIEEKLINKMALNECIENLNIRERKIIFLRYYKCQTQKKVADIIGISQVQVSRIEKKILNNMKRELREA